MSQFMDMIRLPNYGLGVAKGQFDDITHIHKFGAVPAMSQNQTGTIWDVNDTTYPWSSFDTAGTLSIPAVNASDNAKSIVLVGLDNDYLELTETVTVSSSGATTTTQSFKRIFRAYVTNGSVTNVGDIVVQKGGTTVATIKAGKAQTLMAVYTVPAGKTGYILKGVATCQAGADATGDMFVRYFGQDSFRVGHTFEVSGTGGEYLYDFGVPVKIPAKSDIDVRCSVRSNNARVTAAFDIILDED
jgi:hypothetical protein